MAINCIAEALTERTDMITRIGTAALSIQNIVCAYESSEAESDTEPSAMLVRLRQLQVELCSLFYDYAIEDDEDD